MSKEVKIKNSPLFFCRSIVYLTIIIKMRAMMPKIINFFVSIFVLLVLINLTPKLLKEIKDQYKNILKPKTHVARIKINNTIDDISFIQEHLEKFFKNKEIKAILFEIDSPGGAAGSSQALYNEIMHLKIAYKKPLVALTYNLCVSGGYNVAIAADYIIAAPSALIGSIGSYINQFKVNEFLNQWHIQYEIEKSGAYKSALNPFTQSTPQQQEMLQQLADDCYQQFIKDVACRRKLSLKNSAEWANGRIFTGTQALKNGLIDEIGSEFNAAQKIKELALIEREIEWVKPPYPSLFTKLFTSQDTQPLFSFIQQTKSTILNYLSTPIIH